MIYIKFILDVMGKGIIALLVYLGMPKASVDIVCVI